MLAVVGGKGGVGRTTTALGVALALGRECRVVVVDADTDAPDLARMAGIVGGATTERAVAGGDPSPLVALAGGTPAREAGRPHPDCPRVTVVPGGGASPRAARRALARLAAADRQVVVDCPAGAGRAVAGPLRLADRALVVSTPRPSALRDALKSAAMARALDTPVDGVVLTRCRTVPNGTDGLFDGAPVARIPALGDAGSAALPAEYHRVIHHFRRHNG